MNVLNCCLRVLSYFGETRQRDVDSGESMLRCLENRSRGGTLYFKEENNVVKVVHVEDATGNFSKVCNYVLRMLCKTEGYSECNVWIQHRQNGDENNLSSKFQNLIQKNHSELGKVQEGNARLFRALAALENRYNSDLGERELNTAGMSFSEIFPRVTGNVENPMYKPFMQLNSQLIYNGWSQLLTQTF